MPITPDDKLPPTVAAALDKQEKVKPTDAFESMLQKIASPDGQYIPWEKVQLPSKGQYYDGRIPDGWVEVKPFSIDVDKMTSNQRLVASGELLNKIVECCVRFPDDTFSVYDMLAGDQHYLLYYLRGITHGPEYEFVVNCPFCETKSIYEYDLGNLQKTLKTPNPEFPVEPMAVKLPQLSKLQNQEVMALVRLVRVKDIAAMTKISNNVDVHDPINKAKARSKSDKKDAKPKADSDKAYLDGMKLQITGIRIDGVDFNDTRRNILIEKMHQRDTSTIRSFIDSISPGIDTNLEVTCQNSECGKEYAVPLPFGENFFRSTKA